MYLRKTDGQWRGLASERASSEVGDDAVLLFVIPAWAGGRHNLAAPEAEVKRKVISNSEELG